MVYLKTQDFGRFGICAADEKGEALTGYVL